MVNGSADKGAEVGRFALTPAQLKSRRLRNIAIGVTIGVLVVLFYVMTIAKLGAGFLTRPI